MNRYEEMRNRHQQEFENAIAADQTGEGFIFEAFYSELCNHEYSYTGDPTDAIESLNLDAETVRNDPRLLHGLKKAERACKEDKQEDIRNHLREMFDLYKANGKRIVIADREE